MLSVVCHICKKFLKEAGGMLIAPPVIGKSSGLKDYSRVFHVCKSCWEDRIKFRVLGKDKE